jgi:fructose-1-phosphate kinase PfkB-like protein
LFRDLEDPETFYAAALRELVRVTREGGIIVLLTAAKEALEAAISAQADGVRPEERHELLVAGKKAAVYRLRRTSAGKL